MTEIDDLVNFVALRALGVVTDPRRADAPVVELASPDELIELFSQREQLGIFSANNTQSADLDVLCQAVDLVIEKSVHSTHPRFFNQNFAGADPVAVVGDWLSSALNTTMATYEMAPVFTLMENAVLGRLSELIGYRPRQGSGSEVGVDGPGDLLSPAGIMGPGGSSANLMALQMARHRQRPDSIRVGTGSERLRVFTSSSGHYSTGKAAALMGLGTDAVIAVADNTDGSMNAEALSAAVEASISRGEVPLAIVATAGTTVTGAFDDLNALADVAHAHDLWLHVDACFGGAAIFSQRHRYLLDGVEHSDSFVWNPHKMMGLTQQCTMFAVAEPWRLEACFSSQADYLFQPDKLHRELDTGDRTFLCARRVDAFKLWLTWKARGEANFEARINHAVDLADHTRAVIANSQDRAQQTDSAEGRLAAVVAGRFANVVFLWVPPGLDMETASASERGDLHALAPRVKARMQQDGTAMVGYQPVGGLNAFRLLFMNPEVTTDDVDETLALIARYGLDEWQNRDQW